MIEKKDKIELERDFISLLLKYKDLVGEWIESPLVPRYFDASHKNILNAIIQYYNLDVCLTRNAYQSYIDEVVTGKIERNNQYHLYSIINIRPIKRDDFPHLLNKIQEMYIGNETIKVISSYADSVRDNKSSITALRMLSDKIAVLTQDSEVKKQIIYESISDYHQEYYEGLLEKIKKGPDADNIKCHIKEIDDAMGVGFAPGTLTLFCGDVGGYKCGWEKELCQIGDGSYVTFEEIYQRKNNGEDISLLSVDENNKIYLQRILAAHSNGKREVFEIKTRNGFKVSMTGNHPFLTFSGYVNLENLKIGDYVAVGRYGVFGKTKVSDSEALWLGLMLSDGGSSQIGYCFSNKDVSIIESMKKCCEELGGKLLNKGKECDFRVNSLRYLGKKYNIDGKLAIDKSICKEVYTWNKKSLSILLRGMYGCDGSFSKDKNEVIYCTSSEQLAIDVRNILLKYGIISSINSFMSGYKRKDGTYFTRKAYRVIIREIEKVRIFAEEIGFIGEKQTKLESAIKKQIKSNSNLDIIPSSIWDMVRSKFIGGKTMNGCRKFLAGSGKSRGQFPPIYNRKTSGVSRGKLKKIAEYLNNDKELLNIVNSDIYWDKIISIKSIGVYQTYDLSMPKDHNFIANNFITHNSTMMLNVGSNIWEKSKKNVLYIPLEMPRDKMYQKFLSRYSQITFDKLEHPTILIPEDLARIRDKAEEIKKISEDSKSRFYIMEAPEQIPVSMIRREIEKHIDIFKPNIVVVDYIANLIPDRDTYRKDRNDLEIGNMLKSLRNMGKPGAIHDEGFAIVSGAQVGREALKRIRKSGINKSSFFSEDIRGSHEYSADSDNMFVQMEDPQMPGQRLHVFCIKSRYGSKNFSNGSNKAILEINPAISLVKSLNDTFHMDSKELIKGISSIDKIDISKFGKSNNEKENSKKPNSSIDKILGIM